jgi:tetratricopeptide (TPR) repeat protein
MQDHINQWIHDAKQARSAGDSQKAREAYKRAADLARTNGEAALQAHALRHVCELARETGDLTAALAAGQDAVSLYRALPNAVTLDLANALRGTALALEQLKRTQAVAALWREARDIYQDLGVLEGVAECNERLAGMQ